MPVPCQLVRPDCLVYGFEAHPALGLLPAPPVPAVSPLAPWVSIGTTEGFRTYDVASATVIQHGSGTMKLGSENLWMRPHISCASPPAPAAITPIYDMGLIIMNTALGSSKLVWGAFSVKAESRGAIEAVGVIYRPSAAEAPGNQLVCSAPCDLPCLLAAQTPTTVFAGMTVGDYAGCWVLASLDVLVSFVGGLAGDRFGKYVMSNFGGLASRVLSETLGETVVGEVSEKALGWVLGNVDDHISATDALGEGIADEVNGWFE